MLICILSLWLKTFLVSSITFTININQYFEAIIFAVNPLIFLSIIFGLGLFFKPKLQFKYFFTITLLLTSVLYANVVYYREFSDIITLPMLLMSSNMGDLSTSIVALINWFDIFYFLDIIVIAYFFFKRPVWIKAIKVPFKESKAVITTVLIVITIIISQVNALDKAHAFNRQQLIQSLGLYNFYIYDALVQTQTSTQTVFAEKEDLTSILDFLDEKRVAPNEDLFGIAEDMNVIVVSLESVESFVIGETLHGEEITPFLNELIEDSFYFENFYYQTGQGKTSDAEFLVNTSLYPLGRGAVFLTHAENEYRGLPQTLANRGYYTANFHANDISFYNRHIMYPNLGYDHTYSFGDYDISLLNSVGWGMKDIDFVEQTMDYMAEIPEPFYSTLLTLTNHFPYELDEEDHFIEPFDSESDIVNQYFPTVRYTDEAMRIMVDRLKEEGLYENTMLVMYGDHYGIAKSHYEELSKFLGKEITLHEEIKLERVPLIIHIPGVEGKILNTISGQVDVMPTLLNLLGIPEGEHIMFGNDLFTKERENFAVLRDGTVITDELIFTNEICLDYETGEERPLDDCEDIREKGLLELYYSDQLIYGDLLRFDEQ
ncbi:phosphoglycerol transferase MdoB-like AlkP superfamily enzyme [Evansella vedderi]|uniref:Phosphoglycerol transferase MdoB-like AlkP superfamily enzyme n=2 Tax=Evansella vedderi TaxID=38282 RepID=A0ABU0A1F0_9BACI|nr:phosphoglycerol transferase MdoB-like AlkP superfamily enzyme [Evansella vedderi]